MGIHSTKTVPRGAGSVRIIGGEWRGRRLAIPDIPDVRPSPDRVRETLFNWLQGVLPGSHCLDLFAGTGVLGLEAVSRGAHSVTLIDKDPRVVHALQQSAQRLNAGMRVNVICADALSWLQNVQTHYDVAFLDPPYRSNLLVPCLKLLAHKGLAADAHIYLETEAGAHLAAPAHWHLLKSRSAGQVGYHLYFLSGNGEGDTPIGDVV